MLKFLTLGKNDLDKRAIIFPVWFLEYRWRDVVGLHKVALSSLIFTNFIFSWCMFAAIYVVLYVFVGSPKESLMWTGSYGFGAGIGYAILNFKVLQSMSKLVHYTFTGKITQ